MVLDSLRYWVQECHVDGFRFDLAVALGRGRDDEYDPDHPFLVALRTDPVLSRVKLIAEPWDLGIHGWRTGQFPPPFTEWNDRFRDAVRPFWLGDVRAPGRTASTAHGVQDLATRLAGSQDLFGPATGGPIASVNFVAAHDGFTLADLTTYDHKHNEANGEGNRDGSDDNRPGTTASRAATDDARRRRRPGAGSIRNLLGTLLLSTGVPMLNAGDEFGRSQGGNNNAYCQDNETSWFDWDLAPWQPDLLETTRHLVRLRQDLPVLRQRVWALGRQVNDDGTPRHRVVRRRRHRDGRPLGPAGHPDRADVRRRGLDGRRVGAARGQRRRARAPGDAAHGARRHGLPAALGQRLGAPAAGRASAATRPGEGVRDEPARLRGIRRHLT